ncbi:hypothetical protein GCM10029964_122820 [Kibdelosporangium lantanae]
MHPQSHEVRHAQVRRLLEHAPTQVDQLPDDPALQVHRPGDPRVRQPQRGPAAGLGEQVGQHLAADGRAAGVDPLAAQERLADHLLDVGQLVRGHTKILYHPARQMVATLSARPDNVTA